MDSTGHNEVTAAAARLSPQTTTNNKANHLVSVCISRADVNFINYTFILIFFFFLSMRSARLAGGQNTMGGRDFSFGFPIFSSSNPEKKRGKPIA